MTPIAADILRECLALAIVGILLNVLCHTRGDDRRDSEESDPWQRK